MSRGLTAVGVATWLARGVRREKPRGGCRNPASNTRQPDPPPGGTGGIQRPPPELATGGGVLTRPLESGR